MKKIVLGVVVLLLLAVPALPLINGIIVQKKLTQMTEEINTIPSYSKLGIKCEIVSYDRGYASSTIKWKVTLGNLKSLYKTDAILFTEQAKHGFTNVTSVTTLRENSWYQKVIDTYTGGKDPLHINTTYSLQGTMVSNMELDPIATEIEGKPVHIKPSHMTVTCDSKLQHISMNGTVEGIEAANVMTFDKMTLTSDLERVTALIYTGTSAINLTGMHIQEKDETAEIKDLQVGYTLNYEKESNRMGGDLTYSIADFTFPGQSVKDVLLSLSTSGIDVTAYEQAMEIYMEMASGIIAALDDAGDDPQAQQEAVQRQATSMGLQSIGVLEKLLKKDLKISINEFKATLPQGNITGNATITLLQDVTIAQMMPVASQPSLLFDFIDLSSNVRFPKALAGDNPMLTSPIYPGMQTGVFIEDGDYLQHKAETKDKKLYVNDLELAL